MMDQKIYAHQWYSQPGQTCLSPEKGLKNSNTTALASYLPKKASPLSKFSASEDLSIHSTPQVLSRWAPSPPLLRPESVELDGDIEHRSSLSRQPYVGLFTSNASSRLHVHQREFQSSGSRPVEESEAQSLHTAPQHKPFVENLHSLESREAPSSIRIRPEKGQMVYPNMFDTDFGRAPRYLAPAWPSQSVFQPATAPVWDSFEDFHRSQRSGPEWLPAIGPPSSTSPPATGRRKFYLDSDNYVQAAPPLPVPLNPGASSYEQLQVPSVPLLVPPRPFENFIYEMDAEDTSPLIPAQIKVLSTGIGQASSTLKPVSQQSKTILTGTAISQDKPIDIPSEQYRSFVGRAQPFVSHLQIHEDVTVLSGGNERSDQRSALPHFRLVKVTEQSADADGFIDDKTTYKYTAEETMCYDNFYTPANETFYAAQPYTRLNRKLKEFRLLRVFPKSPVWQHYDNRPSWDVSHGKKLDRNQCLIACEIEKTSLTRVGDNYVTLSYCAGDPQKTALVLVDGIPFNAFANLEHAIDRVLAHWSSVHPKGESMLLWADQISINQSDKDERSEQVQIMRNIYRASAEAYVCMSVPNTEDCLSWVPRVSVHSAPQDAVSMEAGGHGVARFKDLLLDFLVGEGDGKELRLFAHSLAATTETMVSGEEPTNQVLCPLKGSLVAPRQQCRTRNSGGILQNRGSIIGKQPPGRVLDSSTDSVVGSKGERNLQSSAMNFQSSLAAFMTNEWWRRSWVYQEFLSATFVHFISGPVSVPWSELSPLVEFICEGLDQFMEEIRKHFESQITEEMRSKDRQQREIERNLRREEHQRKWQREQRKAREVEKRKRKEKQERQRQQLEEERAKRKTEAEREAQRLCRESMEIYSQEKRNFDAERLSQWKMAREVQFHQRAEFEAQQRCQVQLDLTELSQRKEAAKFDLVALVQLHLKLKKLRHFENEVMKPIAEQIAAAVRYSEGSLDPKIDKELEQQCGWRWHDPQRIQALRGLNRVPDDLEKFVSGTLKPPTRPITLVSPRDLELDVYQCWERSQNSHRHGGDEGHTTCPADDHHGSRLGLRQTRQRSATITSNSEVETAPFDVEPELPNEEANDTDEEGPLEQQEPISERLEAREIAQRDKITRLQDDFRRLDRSALASMAKGKKGFRRDSKLITLLQHSRNCAASDPRDRVYAFIGLAESGYDIIPDYGNMNKLEQVLIETAKSIIRHDQSLAILQHVHRGRAKLGVRLPSWVPDWTSQEVNHGIDHHEWEIPQPLDAGKGSRAIGEFRRHAEGGFCEDLKAQGVFVGRVEDIEVGFELEHISSLTLSEGERAYGPKAARFDDEVWVLYGATRPAVLRPEGEDRFGYLGDALICSDDANAEHNKLSPIMYGHMLDRVQEGTAIVKVIWLV